MMIKRTASLYILPLILMGAGLFILPLIHAWMIYPLGIESPYTSYSALGGILPHSDAAGYYSGAHHLLETGELDAWNTRRPLNAILLAVRLWLSNDHFQTTLIIQAFFCSLTCFLVAYSIAKTFGKMAGLITFLVLFLFAATFIPTALSEILGLSLGALGFVFLWEGIAFKPYQQSPHYGYLCLGTLLLTIGLNARAGAFFILPLLILWSALQFNRRAALIITAGIVGGFIFNTVLTQLYIINVDGVTHGNFAPTLFGILAGGKGWTHAYTLYPELMHQSEASSAKFLYEKSLALFLEEPTLLFTGVLKGVWGLTKGFISFFQFKLTGHFLVKALIRLSGALFLLVSIWRLKTLYPYHRKEIGLISVGLLAMILSAGGIWVDGGFRVFAVTIPFFAVAIGIVVGSFYHPPSTYTSFSNIHHSIYRTEATYAYKPIVWETKLAGYLTATILVLGSLGPLMIRTLNTSDSTTILSTVKTSATTSLAHKEISKSQRSHAQYPCSIHETLIIAKAIAGAPKIDFLSLDHLNLFKNSLNRSIIEDKKTFLTALNIDFNDNIQNTESLSMALVYDLKSNQPRFILASTELFSKPQKWIGLCGKPVANAKNITQINSFKVYEAAK